MAVPLLSSESLAKRIELPNGKVFGRKPGETDITFIWQVIRELKGLSLSERRAAIEAIHQQVGARNTFAQPDQYMTWEQVKEMHLTGMEIGAHSCSHPSLAQIPFEEALFEIRWSKKTIEDNRGIPCRHFAFPFGNEGDYSKKLIEEIQNMGFDSYLLNIHGYNRANKNIFIFKRIIMSEFSNLDYILA